MEKDIPVQKNHCYNIEIKDLSHKGQGVGDYQGFTLFVPDAIPGDKVKVKIVKVSKNYAIGKLIKVLAPSANRILENARLHETAGDVRYRIWHMKPSLNTKPDWLNKT